VEEWNWETIFTDNIGLYSTSVTYLASREIEIGKKNALTHGQTEFSSLDRICISCSAVKMAYDLQIVPCGVTSLEISVEIHGKFGQVR